MTARFRMVWMTTNPLPHALVTFARSPRGEGIILIGPEALMRVCPMMHASSFLYGPGKSMPDYSMVVPTQKSQEILQRQEQGEQRRLQQQGQKQHRAHASADKSREMLQQEQRKQQKQMQQRAQAFAATQPKMRRKGLSCRSAHAACCSPGQGLQPNRSLWISSLPSRFKPQSATCLLGWAPCLR